MPQSLPEGHFSAPTSYGVKCQDTWRSFQGLGATGSTFVAVSGEKRQVEIIANLEGDDAVGTIETRDLKRPSDAFGTACYGEGTKSIIFAAKKTFDPRRYMHLTGYCTFVEGFGTAKMIFDSRETAHSYEISGSIVRVPRNGGPKTPTKLTNCKTKLHWFFESVDSIECQDSTGTDRIFCRRFYKSSGGAIERGFCASGGEWRQCN